MDLQLACNARSGDARELRLKLSSCGGQNLTLCMVGPLGLGIQTSVGQSMPVALWLVSRRSGPSSGRCSHHRSTETLGRRSRNSNNFQCSSADDSGAHGYSGHRPLTLNRQFGGVLSVVLFNATPIGSVDNLAQSVRLVLQRRCRAPLSNCRELLLDLGV